MHTTVIVDNFIAPPCHNDIRILYYDDDILLIDKPSGLLSLSGKNPLNKDSVHYRLTQGRLVGAGARAYPEATLAHRLDFGTSGIMLVALNKTANAAITRQFQARTVSKTYLAILDGTLANDHGEIQYAIAKDPAHFPRQTLCAVTGKAAISEYHVVARLQNPARTKVCFTPLTGRTHQLRIHSLAFGHPILGCDLYRNDRSQAMAPRLLLHASTLNFTHPTTGAAMAGLSPCPF